MCPPIDPGFHNDYIKCSDLDLSRIPKIDRKFRSKGSTGGLKSSSTEMQKAWILVSFSFI